MKNIIGIIVVSVLLLSGCEKYDVVHTGKAQEINNCSMWEYLQRGHYDWDSITIAIQHAGIQDIFDGTDTSYPQITFFGITNWSVKHFLKQQGYTCIKDIPREECRRMILSHVVAGKYLKNDFEFEVKNTLEGGTILPSLLDKALRIYRIKTDFEKLPDGGVPLLGIHGMESGQIALVASSNNQVTNGVVHSLAYEYEWTEL